ncbi:hypothetical protein K491DRAFT_597870 [Lophiostoma macrostomum CBS 122681]|uniref:Zn(2)-C6 fungal-type domain-containing protein n=1 Tax=Lophiostoma macrostomum CBS 122681 TaxID=1314788 RepID=A0A6A6TBF8_9PLEO|nr:hypothetical protein K491DRAFT_597870 [Lophiostoma macrostomum CBS 122681]
MEGVIGSASNNNGPQPSNFSLFGGQRHDPNPLNNRTVNRPDSSDPQSGDPATGFDHLFPNGFSDEDGEAASQAFDRTFPGHKKKGKGKAKQDSPRQKKSPRRSEDDDSNESPRGRKSRKSLFGGPFLQSDNDEDDEDMQAAHTYNNGSSFTDDIGLPDDIASDQAATTKDGVRNRMSSLTLSVEGDNEDHFAGPSTYSPNFDHEDENIYNADDDDDENLRRSESPAHSDHSYNLPRAIRKELQNPYELRKTLNRNVPGTWVDLDQTGDYDPEAERAAKRAKAKEAKERRKRGKAPKPRKEVVPKYIVRLPFPNKIGDVLNRTDEEQNWPEGWSEVDSEEETEMAEIRAFYRKSTPGVQPQRPIGDPKGECDDLTGHPCARGCVSCRVRGADCSMINGGAWPCEQCVEDEIEHDCTPIIEPVIKGKCRECRESCAEDEENTCSFEQIGQDGSGREDHDLCDQCLEKGDLGCVAEPPQGYKAPRIDLDELSYGPGRKHANCTNCRATGKRCSIKKKSEKGPCKQCKRAKIGCTFLDTPPKSATPKKVDKGKRKAGAKAQMEKGESSRAGAQEGRQDRGGTPFFTAQDLADLDDDDEEIVRQPTPEIEMEDAKGRRGFVTKIRTSFAHPVEFMNTAADCNFCDMPIFGFVGHFEREVHVLRWANGLGYTELQGGHREEHLATTMCGACTISRVQIISCERHEIRAIEGQDAEQDMNAAAEDLMSAEPGSDTMSYQQQRWCSMCFSLAVFKCVTPQFSFWMDDDEGEVEIEGCGLRFCRDCELKFRETYDGNLNTMATVMDLEPKVGEDEEPDPDSPSVRADVGFLRREGLLMKTVEAETAGDGDDVMDVVS